MGIRDRVQRPELGKCLGTYEELESILEKNMVDEVIVALEPHEIQFMKQVLDAADKLGARISIIPFYNDYIPAHPSIDVVGKTKLINMRATPLDNVLLLSLIHISILKGAGTPMLTRIPSGVNGCNEDLVGKYNYDPEKAKELLAEAGYPDGFSMKLEAPTGKYLMDAEISQAIVAMLSQVGITVDLQLLESSAYSCLLYTSRAKALKKWPAWWWTS